MDKTSTPELRKHNFDEKLVRQKKTIGVNNNIPFETNLKTLLDNELVNPREQVVIDILDISKRIL